MLAMRYLLIALLLVGCGGGSDPAPTTEPAPVTTTGPFVFIGDSITAAWGTETLVPGSVNKGVPGENPCQIKARMQADVIALRPTRVHIMGGANGIVDDHPTQAPCIIEAAAMAVAAGAKVYVGTVTPGYDRPQAGVVEFNRQLREAAAMYGYTVVDYYPAMLTRGAYFDQSLYLDTVHPNASGYARMEAVFRDVVR